jgi:hypothetical protein
MKHILSKSLFICLLSFGFVLIKTNAQQTRRVSLVNTTHLDYLYQDINFDGKDMGIIHIYADYPDYHYVEASGEGIACVDDAARALIFYIRYYKVKQDKNVLDKIKGLTAFMLYMQAENGFFYNFIWKDYTRDTTYKTSVAEPNWWSWRAIWALAEACDFYKKSDEKYYLQIKPALDKSIKVTTDWLDNNDTDSTSIYNGFKLTYILPSGTAADQAAVIVKAFCAYYKTNKNILIKKEIERLCSGIMKMQAGNKNDFPYYAFLSWQNTWHMWGNSQADALIDAGRLLHKRQYINSALKEVKYFYPFLIKNDYVSSFTVEKRLNQIIIKNSIKFPQIAYGIRPLVMAGLGAGNKASAKLAGRAACWLLGKNLVGKALYNPKTGICFDGIQSAEELNKNSGAESTIESLLTILAIEQNPAARRILFNFNKNHNY